MLYKLILYNVHMYVNLVSSYQDLRLTILTIARIKWISNKQWSQQHYDMSHWESNEILMAHVAVQVQDLVWYTSND